jgi:putative chitinase
MTISQLQPVAGTASAQLFLPSINDTLNTYDILTPARQLSFLAQVSHESGGFFYTEELASGTAYEGRRDLGNTQPGDGVKFKGRGLIQITGRTNYTALGKAFQIDLVNDPSLLAGKNSHACTPDQLKYAALSAGWFWHGANLNAIADNIDVAHPIDEGANLENFKAITRRINGGYNGLADRIQKWKSLLPVITIL